MPRVGSLNTHSYWRQFRNCRRCGYDWKGLKNRLDPCPECGEVPRPDHDQNPPSDSDIKLEAWPGSKPGRALTWLIWLPMILFGSCLFLGGVLALLEAIFGPNPDAW